MFKEVISPIHYRTQPKVDNTADNVSLDSIDDRDYESAQTSWSKLWKISYMSYIPLTVSVEAFLIVLMSQWSINTQAEKEIINSMVGGWTTMLFAQIVIPFLSFTIRSLIGSFMLPRYEINILGSFSRSKTIPIMLLMFVGSVMFFALFSWMAKEYSLYASVTTGFLYINFYLTGIVTTLSWVAFVLERQNPYKIHDNYGPEN